MTELCSRFKSDPAADAALENVTVTAQKRAEDAQMVPITMTPLPGRTLADHRVQNLGDLSRLVPGLLISTFSEDSPTIAIRGANNTFQQIGVNKPVAVVVDDVFAPNTMSQELRYASPRWDAGNLVAGFYFLNEDGWRQLTDRSLAATGRRPGQRHARRTANAVPQPARVVFNSVTDILDIVNAAAASRHLGCVDGCACVRDRRELRPPADVTRSQGYCLRPDLARWPVASPRRAAASPP
jgi:hypothetical protein